MIDVINKPHEEDAAWQARLAEVPVDRVTHLRGVSAADIVAMAACHDDLPAVVAFAPIGTDGTATAFVARAIDELDAIARQLVHGWLPEASEVEGPRGAALIAIRAVAIERAHANGCPSAFLADLAERSLTGRASPRAHLRPQVRIGGLARVIAIGFCRDRLALSVPASNVAVAGAEWLAHHGRLGVWLTGAESPDPSRISTVCVPPLREPPPALAGNGRPHPRSTVEASLEAVLRKHEEWAHGRIWNATYQPTITRLPIRPDLIWPAERVVVELDGPEHCRPAQYHADRVRDVQLQLDGFAVLRFTNVYVRHDVQVVAAQIEQLIRSRRRDFTKGHQGG